MKNNIKTAIIVLIGIKIFSSCSSAEEEIAKKTAEAGKKNSESTLLKPEGSAVFKKYCVACHGADGKLGLNGAKDFSKSTLSLPERVSIITKGKGVMTPFGSLLSPEEIQAVAEYTTTFK